MQKQRHTVSEPKQKENTWHEKQVWSDTDKHVTKTDVNLPQQVVETFSEIKVEKSLEGMKITSWPSKHLEALAMVPYQQLTLNPDRYAYRHKNTILDGVHSVDYTWTQLVFCPYISKFSTGLLELLFVLFVEKPQYSFKLSNLTLD